MSLLDENGNIRVQKGRKDGKKEGMKELISWFIDSGESIPELSKKLGMPKSELQNILK